MDSHPRAPHGRRLAAGSGFPDDDGRADATLARAVAAHAVGPGPEPRAELLHLLRDARLLVPVVAVAEEVETGAHGLAQEKSSEMAAVLLQGADGRMALLAFTGLDSLTAWNPAARPVPVSAVDAARSARQEGAAALVVDVAGPHPVVVEGVDLEGLAQGWRPVLAGGRVGWAAVAAGSAPPST